MLSLGLLLEHELLGELIHELEPQQRVVVHLVVLEQDLSLSKLDGVISEEASSHGNLH